MKSRKVFFEENYSIIEKEVNRLRGYWSLHAIPSLDFSDFSQLCIIHIWNKIHLFDKKRDLRKWVSAVASSQWKNFLRDNLRCVRPCTRCPMARPDEGCEFTSTKTQTVECPFFRKWVETNQKDAFHIKMPLSQENHQSEVRSVPVDNNFDYDSNKIRFEKVFLPTLSDLEKEIYDLLFIKHLSIGQVAQKLGYKTDRNRKSEPTCKRLEDIELQIVQKAKKFLLESEIEIDIF